MAKRAIWLSERTSHGVRQKVLEATFSRHQRLSQEQRVAIEHVAGEGLDRAGEAVGVGGECSDGGHFVVSVSLSGRDHRNLDGCRRTGGDQPAP